jgi:hypothetical protein
VGRKPAGGVLGVDAHLDGVAVQADVVLRERQRLAGCHPELLLDEVEAGDELGHGVLDLQAGVHLHEEELVGGVRADDELHRARAGVADRAGGVDGGASDAGAGRLVEQYRGCLLDHLLVAALQAALALAEVHDVAVVVGEDLHLDVPRRQHEPLEEEGVVAEAAGRLTPR